MSREYQVGDLFINETIDLENEFQLGGIFFTLTSVTPAAANNWFFDARSKGWFKDVFASADHNPMALMVFDGDSPDDRVLLLGSEDGYVRKIDSSVVTDDGTAIEAFAIIGPLSSGDTAIPLILSELQSHTDPDGNVLKYEVLIGDTPEEALETEAATFSGDGTFEAGMGFADNPRERGYYVYLKVGTTDASTAWALEKIRAKLSLVKTGKGRTRISETFAYPLT